jgi:hypothetical protein
MCMIIGDRPVHVAKTNIFVGKVNSQIDQFVIYSNDITDGPIKKHDYNVDYNAPRLFQSDQEHKSYTAMILPYPTNTLNSRIKVYDMSKHVDIFKKLKEYFPNPPIRSRSGFGSSSYNSVGSSIKVEKVGSYDVSIVPSLEDFDRLQDYVFKLDPNFKKVLSRDYSKDYGFIVCKIRDGEKFHPIAYSHSLREDGTFFIPTKHYHNGSESNPDWDHIIYILGGDINTLNEKGIMVRKVDTFNKDKLNMVKQSYNNERLRLFGDNNVNTFPFELKLDNRLVSMTIDNRYNNNHDILVKSY